MFISSNKSKTYILNFKGMQKICLNTKNLKCIINKLNKALTILRQMFKKNKKVFMNPIEFKLGFSKFLANGPFKEIKKALAPFKILLKST